MQKLQRLSNSRIYLVIFLGLVLALSVPIYLRSMPVDARTHTISLEARKYGYSPSKIVVNKGDKVVIKPTSLDVTHGFALGGYPLEFIIKQQGIAYLKYTWKALHLDLGGF